MASLQFTVAAEDFPVIEIRMKVSSGSMAQLFFVTGSDDVYDEPESQWFSIIGDAQFHIYNLEMSRVPAWDGNITQIRLDPVELRASIEVDYVRILSP